MKEASFRPDTSAVLREGSDEEKEHHLGHHSEKLAIGLGVDQNTPRHSPHDLHEPPSLFRLSSSDQIHIIDNQQRDHFK